MKKKKSLNECAYCGEMAITTMDHIPPKNIYCEPRPPNDKLPQVDACNKCHNKKTSLDDEYFRDIVIKSHLVSDRPQVQPLLEKMFRGLSYPKKKKYAQATLRSFSEASVGTFEGIYLGRRPAIKIDQARLQRTVIRYVKGLHKWFFHSRVQDDAIIRVSFDPENIWNKQSDFLKLFESRRWVGIQKESFVFKVLKLDDMPGWSAWLLLFYESFPIFGYIKPPDS